MWGFLLTLIFEWGNPQTLGAMPTQDKVLAAAFQSVTLRTAGFNTIDQAALTGPSQAVACLLMMIGGSPGSTAGGIKTVTAAVLVLSAISALRGRTTVSAFGRTIVSRSIMNAVTMMIVGGMLSLTGACVISYVESAPFGACLFEAVSAFANGWPFDGADTYAAYDFSPDFNFADVSGARWRADFGRCGADAASGAAQNAVSRCGCNGRINEFRINRRRLGECDPFW